MSQHEASEPKADRPSALTRLAADLFSQDCPHASVLLRRSACLICLRAALESVVSECAEQVRPAWGDAASGKILRAWGIE